MSPNQNSPQHPLRLVLNQVQIAADNIPVKELLEVEFEGEVWGPIWCTHLKSHLEAFKVLTKQLRVRDIGSEMEWIEVMQHPFFQKRTQDPLPAIPKRQVGNIFYILEGGQKIGPLTKEQILEKINSYELVMTDPISVDMGNNWIKVYQIEEFDRRLTNDQINGSAELENLYENLRNHNIAGLKVIQSLTKEKSTNPTYDFTNTTIQSQKRKSDTGDRLEIKWLALFIIAVIGIVTILREWNSAPEAEKRKPASVKDRKVSERKSPGAKGPRKVLRSPASKSSANVIKKKAVKNTSTKNQLIQKTSAKRMNRPRTRTNRSIRESAALKSVRSPASDSSNDYFDDGSTPDEQDPVRSQVSKETLDPEGEYDSKQQDEPFYSPPSKQKPFIKR